MVYRPPRPHATYIIIAICVAVWLGELASPTFFDDVALSPAQGRDEPWRFLTSAFAHSTNIAHIFFNMLALWMLGRGLELFLKSARFLAIYLLSALGGGVTLVLMSSPPSAGGGLSWYTEVVGASGAIFGLFGALVPIYRSLGQSLNQLWGVLAINAMLTFVVPNIAWQAHVGGFLTGLLCGAIVMHEATARRHGHPDRTWWWLAAVLVVIVGAAVVKYAMAG